MNCWWKIVAAQLCIMSEARKNTESTILLDSVSLLNLRSIIIIIIMMMMMMMYLYIEERKEQNSK